MMKERWRRRRSWWEGGKKRERWENKGRETDGMWWIGDG
jgi:hypothetical protein